MSDPIAMGDGLGIIGGAAGFVAMLVALLKSSAGRNVKGLDESIEKLNTTIETLGKDIAGLRETNVGIGKDIGALQEGHRNTLARIEGQGAFWHAQFDKMRTDVHERMTKATHDMLETVEQVASSAIKKPRAR